MIITILIIVLMLIFIIALKNDQEKGERLGKRERAYQYFKEQEKNDKESNTEKKTEIREKVLSEYEKDFLNGNGGTINIAIKGLYYRTEEAIIEARRLMCGSIVSLKKESDNPQDSYAVAVYTNSGNHIGYVPKEYSKGISGLIDKELPIECVITKRTNDEVPFLYMDVSYKSIQQQDIDKKLENKLIDKLTKLGLQETRKLRWEYVFSESKPNISDKTLNITATHKDYGFNVKETLETKDGSVKVIEYAYNQNIGRNNLEIAERLEKANDIEGAISKYEFNLQIEECLADSAHRLSVLYKKNNRHKDVIPMLQSALEKAKEQNDSVDANKITERLNTFLNNTSFTAKYGSK